MVNAFKSDDFRDPLFVSWAVIGLLALNVICAVIYSMFGGMIIVFPEWIVYAEDGGVITLFAFLVNTIAVLEFPLRIATGIAFLFWVHRAYSNLSALKARNLEFTPGWAVGWWFIPFANLVKPFQVIRELFNESDPDFDVETGYLHTPSGTPVEVGFWWGTLLTSNVLYRISNALYGSGEQPDSEYHAPFFLGGALFAVAAGTLAIYIVRETTRRQLKRFDLILSSSGNIDQPPPPPVFGDSFSFSADEPREAIPQPKPEGADLPPNRD